MLMCRLTKQLRHPARLDWRPSLAGQWPAEIAHHFHADGQASTPVSRFGIEEIRLPRSFAASAAHSERTILAGGAFTAQKQTGSSLSRISNAPNASDLDDFTFFPRACVKL